MDIDELHGWHDRLYKDAVETYIPRYSKEGTIDQGAVEDIEHLLHEIETHSSQVNLIDDFQWLADTAGKWQVILSALNIPRAVELALPERHLKSPATALNYISEIEIDAQIRERAYLISRERISRRAEILFNYMKSIDNIMELASDPIRIFSLIGYMSDEEDERSDWYSASLAFASDVLAGKVNFWREIGPPSYWRLESHWAEEIKQLRAFALWCGRGGGWGEASKQDDFMVACADLASVLIEPQKKVPPSHFSVVFDYLRERFLSNGRVDLDKPGTRALVKRKSERLYDVRWSTDGGRNWSQAESYVRLYYELIIQAVIADDQEAKARLYSVLTCTNEAMDAAQIISCFELALFQQFVGFAPGTESEGM